MRHSKDNNVRLGPNELSALATMSEAKRPILKILRPLMEEGLLDDGIDVSKRGFYIESDMHSIIKYAYLVDYNHLHKSISYDNILIVVNTKVHGRGGILVTTANQDLNRAQIELIFD